MNRLGVFIHWGIFALTGLHEQAQIRRNQPFAEYSRLAQQFNPTLYDPDEWVRAVKAAGAEYICFVTKHHDGFCMWDTAQTDYNIMHTPYGRDTLKLLSEACARQGMALSLYYSIPDWSRPDSAINPRYPHYWSSLPESEPNAESYIKYIKAQLTELLTNYGPIYTLFWDIPPQIDDPSVNALARSLQPDILINDRGFDAGDFSTPERELPSGKPFPRMTEACQSFGHQSWGWREDEDYFTVKFLEQSIDSVMARGGNYLLNIGPRPDGTLPAECLTRLDAVGKWYRAVKPSLVGAEPEDVGAGTNLVTRAGGTLYVHMHSPAPRSGITLTALAKLPRSARVLNDGTPLRCEITQMPEDFDWRAHKMGPACLHVFDIPVDRLEGEEIVLELEF